MTPEEILEKLEDLAEGFCIKVVYARLGDAEVPFSGGSCTLRGQPLIIVEQNLPAEEKVKVLAQELGRLDWSGVFLPPKVRELLGEEKG
jgi:hypothetical protein